MGDMLNNLPALPENLGSLFNFGGSVSFDQIISHLGAYFNGLIAKLVAMVPEQIMAVYNQHKILVLLAIICILGIVAFEGYRLFRMLVYAGSAFLFSLVGYWYIAPMLAEKIQPMVPEMMDYSVAVAVICAIVSILLCTFAFRLVIFIFGGAAGYILGSSYVYGFMLSYFSSLEFLKAESVKHIVGGIIAVITAIVFALMLKSLFRLATSFGGSIGAAVILQSILVPGADGVIKISFIILGVAVALLAIAIQHKQEEDIIFRF